MVQLKMDIGRLNDMSKAKDNLENIFFLDASVKKIAQSHEAYVYWCDDVVVSLKFKIDNQKEMYLSVYQKNDMPAFYLSEENIFEDLCNRSAHPYLLKYKTLFFYGYKLDWYESIYPAIYRHFDSPYSILIRLICFMAREGINDVFSFIEHNKGKSVISVDIPTTDFEEMFLNHKLAQ